jgi:hypothetical protein
MSYPLCETAGLPMKPDLTEATVTAGKRAYVIHPTDDLEFVPEAIIITRANGQRIVLANEHLTSIRIPGKKLV